MRALDLTPAYKDIQFATLDTSETFGIQCTPAGLQEAAAAFQEGEFAPSQFPEVAYMDTSDGGLFCNSDFNKVLVLCIDKSKKFALCDQSVLSCWLVNKLDVA
jgi:hypothetical protein